MANMDIAASSSFGHTRYCVAPHNPPIAPALARQLSSILVVLSATVFSRFGINLGTYSISFGLIAVYGLVAVTLLSGNLAIDPRRLLAYCACVVVAIASFVLNTNLSSTDRSSWTSLLALIATYFPLVFVWCTEGTGERQVLWTMRMFSNVALLCACAGIAQFYAQFVIHSAWLFDFTPYIPAGLRGSSAVNTVIPVGSLYKSNGFFFQEPSGASFVMALGLLLEMTLFHRPLRLAALALALALTYSGTGLLALLIGIVFSVRRRTIGRLASILAVAGLCAWAASDVLNLSFTLKRINEFSSEESSGYHRYIAPMRLVSDMLFSQPWSAWLGLGPGTISRLSMDAYVFHDPTWAKLLVEYGVLGFTAFVGLMLISVRQRFLPLQVKAVLFFSWLVMGGHLLTSGHVYLVFVLSGLLGSAPLAPSGNKPEYVVTSKGRSAAEKDAL